MTWGLDTVTARFGPRVALDDVSLSVPEGEVTAVVGGDGAGKTTLARLMVGLMRPDRGKVRRPETRRIGYQSEASGVWRDLTVTENLEFVAAAHKLRPEVRNQRIDELLDVTRLGPARDRLAANLSGGMRQKLGVAMALLPDPELLILDEPTTGLDPVSRTELWTLVARAAAAGTAVLATTSYLDEAERGATVLVLEQGHTLASGTVSDVRSATPGMVAVVAPEFDSPFKWRRGPTWRAWFPDGSAPDGIASTEPDLSDLVTVAALARRRGQAT